MLTHAINICLNDNSTRFYGTQTSNLPDSFKVFSWVVSFLIFRILERVINIWFCSRLNDFKLCALPGLSDLASEKCYSLTLWQALWINYRSVIPSINLFKWQSKVVGWSYTKHLLAVRHSTSLPNEARKKMSNVSVLDDCCRVGVETSFKRAY